MCCQVRGEFDGTTTVGYGVRVAVEVWAEIRFAEGCGWNYGGEDLGLGFKLGLELVLGIVG